jgi:shikimate kinase
MVGAAAARRASSVPENAGAIITVINRPDEMASALAKTFDCNGLHSRIWPFRPQYPIIITALPPGVRVIEPEWLNSRQIIMDANYKNSEMEPLAKAVGAQFIPGTVWLTEQARPAYELFTGSQATSDIPPEIINGDPYAGKANVILTGFMGAGKSTLGPQLAAKLNWRFVDIDQVITEQTGKSINAIFNENGEAEFRRLETSALAQTLEGSHQIISGGGGIVLGEANRDLILKKVLCIWLFARPRQIWPRIELADRPLLHADDPLLAAERIFAERSDLYFSSSDAILDTEAATPETCRIYYMRKSVKYSTIDGIIAAPASKSVVQRVIAAALLADGTSHFDNVTLCDDSQAAISIARALGAKY